MAEDTGRRRKAEAPADTPAPLVQLSEQEVKVAEAQNEAVASQDDNREQPEEQEFKTVTYDGEKPTIRTLYGTFVKGQEVRLPADIANSLSVGTNPDGSPTFKVK